MSIVQPTDDDFRVCELVLADLVELQQDAERRGFSTRWTSVSALQDQVDDKPALLIALLRQKRHETLAAYRCLVRYHPTDPTGGDVVVTTVDVSPDRLDALKATYGDHRELGAYLLRLPVAPKP